MPVSTYSVLASLQISHLEEQGTETTQVAQIV